MKNVHEDAQTFVKNFKKAVDRSSIRKTSKADDVKRLAETFEKQTEGMRRNFDRDKKADAELPLVFRSMRQLDEVITELNLTGEVSSNWKKVRGELDQVAQQFNVPASGN